MKNQRSIKDIADWNHSSEFDKGVCNDKKRPIHINNRSRYLGPATRNTSEIFYPCATAVNLMFVREEGKHDVFGRQMIRDS